MNRILIKPAKRKFSKRQQWVFELRGGNGERIDPRDTVFNRTDLANQLQSMFLHDELELVVQDRHGKIESQVQLR